MKSTVIQLRAPTAADGAAVHALIRRSPPLDLNSCYAYLLQGLHITDTCVVAEVSGHIVGYVSGYRLPRAPDTLFVWQVAVDPAYRGQSLGNRMLRHLLSRDSCQKVRWLETTITPGNTASLRMFKQLAQILDCQCSTSSLFSTASFGGTDHEEEELYRIGPLPCSG
jgi:L-2,4-diaminobutyric acid acetyltransferase